MHTTHHTTARSVVEELAASAPGADAIDIGTTVDIVSSAFARIQDSIGPIDMTVTVNEGVFGVWVHILARRPDGAVVNIKVDDEIIVHVNGRPFLYPSSGENNGWPMTSLGLIEALGDTGLMLSDVTKGLHTDRLIDRLSASGEEGVALDAAIDALELVGTTLVELTTDVYSGTWGTGVRLSGRRLDGASAVVSVYDVVSVGIDGKDVHDPATGKVRTWPVRSEAVLDALAVAGLVDPKITGIGGATAAKDGSAPAPEVRNVYQDTLSPAETNKALNRELAGLRREGILPESVLSALGWAFMHATALHRPFSIKAHGPADSPYAVLTGTTREGVETTVVVSRSAVTTVRTDEDGIVGNDCAEQRAMSPEDLVEALDSNGVMGFDAQTPAEETAPSTDPETFVSVLVGSPKIVRSTVRRASTAPQNASEIAGALRPAASNLDDVLYARTAGALSLVTTMPSTYVTEHNGRDALTLLFEAPDPDGVRTHGVHVTRRGVYPLRGTEPLERLLPTWLLSVEAVAAALERIEGVELAETSREDAADPVLHESIGLEGSTVTAVLPDSDGKSLIIDLRTPDGILVTLHRARA